MDKPRPCGCKGCRTCLVCEKEFRITPKPPNLNRELSYVFCPFCSKAWPGWNWDDYKTHPNHRGSPMDFPGVYIDLNFITEAEETKLIKNLDSLPWDLSQSGRRKQNFGPKCNFKKRKLRVADFTGFPKFSQFIQEKFKTVSILTDYNAVEQCSLEYDPKRGACIDPHIDDCWIWGERVVTVNLLSDSVLTMNFNNKPERYNLDCVKTYPKVVSDNGISFHGSAYDVQRMEAGKIYPVVRIPLPRRSLLVMYGPARYEWEHQVLRSDITSRRVCLAYREFTPTYLKDGERYHDALEIILWAREFWDYMPES